MGGGGEKLSEIKRIEEEAKDGQEEDGSEWDFSSKHVSNNF